MIDNGKEPDGDEIGGDDFDFDFREPRGRAAVDLLWLAFAAITVSLFVIFAGR